MEGIYIWKYLFYYYIFINFLFSFFRVYLVDADVGTSFAAKIMPSTLINQNEWDNIKLLSKYKKSPYVLSYLFQKMKHGHIIMLMEYANWKVYKIILNHFLYLLILLWNAQSLSYLVNSGRRFPERIVINIMFQLCLFNKSFFRLFSIKFLYNYYYLYSILHPIFIINLIYNLYLLRI